MGYYVYKNYPVNKARIHRAECGCCNNGYGCHIKTAGNKNDEWSKKFKNFKDAESYAKKPHKGMCLKLSYCKKCKPKKI